MVVPKRMTEANEQEANEQEQKRPLTLGRSGTRLELRRPVETGQVRQSFSHGRSKTVTVEVRKKRTIGPTTEPGRAEAAPAVAREQTPLRPAAEEPVRRPIASCVRALGHSWLLTCCPLSSVHCPLSTPRAE